MRSFCKRLWTIATTSPSVYSCRLSKLEIYFSLWAIIFIRIRVWRKKMRGERRWAGWGAECDIIMRTRTRLCCLTPAIKYTRLLTAVLQRQRERVLQQPAAAGETAALAGRTMKVRSQAQMTGSGEEYFLTLPGTPGTRPALSLRCE